MQVLCLSEVLAEPTLGLESLVDAGDPRIEWAHVSELIDPAPWLTGGELLLTTGLELFEDGFDSAEYCLRLASAGVSALGISTGASLPHAAPPQSLLEGATAAGMNLVHVPEGTPLQAVVRWVSHSLNEAENLPLRQALVAQRQLSEAATSADGLQAVIEVLEKTSGFAARVTDPSLRPLAATGDIDEPTLERFRAEVRGRLRTGLRWSITDETGSGDDLCTAFVSPLGTTGQLRGVIIAVKAGRASAYDRALMSMVYSHLSVLLQLRHAAAFQEREARSSAVQDLLFGELGEVDATLRLARAGVHAEHLAVVSLSRELTATEQVLLTANLEGAADDVLFYQDERRSIAVLANPGENVTAHIEDALGSDGVVHAGVGGSVTVTSAKASLRQAERARRIAESRRKTVVELPRYEGYRAMLGLGTEAERIAFADEVLGPLDRHDPDRKMRLVDALRLYLRLAGSMEGVSGQLGMHRHTLRTRLALISELTGRSLVEPDDRFELWLAVEMRDLTEAGE